MAIALRYAARSDIGLGRYTNNQDSGYAGPHLLVVADGMGGHAAGDVASSLAVAELSALDGESHGADALAHLADAVRRANDAVARRVAEQPQLSGMGTTVTAVLRTGNRLALAHIGDSRAYLLRAGELTQITHDHTFVQSLVDEGRITAEEADTHPQRNVILRALDGHEGTPDGLDLSVREARAGDRLLLCSDGLSGYVSHDTLRDELSGGDEPGETADRLVQLALRAGGADNITAVVADVVEGDRGAVPATTPAVVGAAASSQPERSGASGTPAAKAAALVRPPRDDDEDGGGPVAADRRPSRARGLRRGLAAALLLLVVAGGAYGAWRFVQQQYFVGDDDGVVAVYRGLPDDLGPVGTSSVVERTDVRLVDLRPATRDRLSERITADDLEDARSIVERLEAEARACTEPAPTASPSPTPSATPSATSSPTASPSPTPTPEPEPEPELPAYCGEA